MNPIGWNTSPPTPTPTPTLDWSQLNRYYFGSGMLGVCANCRLRENVILATNLNIVCLCEALKKITILFQKETLTL